MLVRSKKRPAKSCCKISATWALLLVCTTDLLIASSAFLFIEKPFSHFQFVTRNQDTYSNGFSRRVLSFGSTTETNTVARSAVSSSSDGTSESSTPLSTSNNFMTPEEVVSTCMTNLQLHEHAGLEICYNFSSDSCRMANGGSLESFLQQANNPVFRSMIDCIQWEVINVGPEIKGTPTRGTLQTVLVHVVPKVAESGALRNDRTFLWTIVKERRPPRQGHCLVHECIAVENAFAHTL